MWKYMYFKLNNTIILYKPRTVFNIPQEMSNFVHFTEYFDLRPKQQAYLTLGQRYLCFYQKWLCLLQHRVNGSHLTIGS